MSNILTIKTVQITPFRVLMLALKDILLETNITFTNHGIKIINMDKSHTVLVHTFLEAENFEHYECTKAKILIGVNMLHLFRLINSIDNNDTLTIYIEKDDYYDGVVSYLGLKFENGDIKQCKIQKLRLIEPDEEELEIPKVTFTSVLNMPSIDFQKIVRDLGFLSDKVEIKSLDNELIFKCNGSFANVEIRRSELNGSLDYKLKPDSKKIVQGVFSLKNLSYFIKCTPLCNQIELYLENDLPLIVQYHIASLGIIKLCLSPLPCENLL